MKLFFEKVKVLPATLVGNTVYLVHKDASGNAVPYVEVYYTSADGNSIYRQPTTSDIQALITTALQGVNTGGGVAEVIYATTYNDMITKVYTANAMILVHDATGDAGVKAGAALYFFNFADTTFNRIAKYETMNLVLDWNALLNRPESTVAQIDDAVAKAHSHANVDVLNALGTNENNDLTFNGAVVVGDNLVAVNW